LGRSATEVGAGAAVADTIIDPLTRDGPRPEKSGAGAATFR
jgi:hypothetical protein